MPCLKENILEYLKQILLEKWIRNNSFKLGCHRDRGNAGAK